MRPDKIVGIRRSFLKPDEIGKGRVMGIWKFLGGLWPSSAPLEDDAPRRTVAIERLATEVPPSRHPLDIEHDIAVQARGRAPMNRTGELIVAGEEPRRTATQLIEQAGDSVPALAQALTVIAERFETSVRSTDQLNRALGEFREAVVGPFREELRFLRFNLGDKVNHTTTNLEVMVSQLDKVIWANLRAQGFSEEKIREFRIEHGMQPEAPKGGELELHVAEHQGLIDQVAALTAQNHRLLTMLNAKHVQWPEDGGNYVYHEGCLCEACRARESGERMAAEVSGEARSRSATVLPAATDKKPAAKTPDRRKRRGS